ncbi:uncharacterized protein LOC119098351 [Pollicipes pollicipes]|uniref:uncharacterized protein LOC119098351 n=1 Tax=Pollicipes pollicipes TaxID=41117 RepID=UPI001884D097|nr:uncharacterized protein LOC119098351 [Pollicipes pollicipes]
MLGYREVDVWSRRHEVHAMRGQVTTSCLWNACRAMGLGLLLVTVGAAMATMGYYSQRSLHQPALSPAPDASNGSLLSRQRARQAADLTFRHLSYFGSVVMGIGGFIVVASCVMTFEARDSAAKVVPARFRGQPEATTTHDSPGLRSSACQTLPCSPRSGRGWSTDDDGKRERIESLRLDTAGRRNVFVYMEHGTGDDVLTVAASFLDRWLVEKWWLLSGPPAVVVPASWNVGWCRSGGCSPARWLM